MFVFCISTSTGQLASTSEWARQRRFVAYRTNLTHTEILLGSVDSISAEMVGGRVLVIYCHGFGDGPTFTDGGKKIIEAYLQSNLDVNVIAVDWVKLCWKWDTLQLLNPAGLFKRYLACIKNMDVVGERVVAFILWLKSLGLADEERVHLLGWSLGGQLVGKIGREFQKSSNGRKLARVTAMDPAGPLFNVPPIYLKDVVRSGDAKFVDVYHTSPGLAGDFISVGDADVFMNKILIQPSAHSLSVKAFAASFRREFVGCQFKVSLLEGKCENPTVIGLFMPPSARGKYYAKVTGV